MFYKLLEAFIFNDILINEHLSETFLILLYKTYKSKNELELLSHLFIHINLECLSSPAIIKLALDENLFSLIIYIKSNGFTYEDYFIPINKMFEFFISKNIEYDIDSIDKNEEEYKYFNYCEIYGEKGYKGLNEMEKSKEYIGHKLLWYIEQSLKGNKLGSNKKYELLKFNISSENYKYFVSLIFYWILQKKVFLILLKFDSYSLFRVLNIFFTETIIVKIIQEFNFNLFSDEQFQNIIKINIQNNTENNSNDNDIKYNDINNVLLYIIKLTEEENNYLCNQDLDNLLIKYASNYQNFSDIPELIKNKIFNSVNNLLKFLSNYAIIRHDLIKNNKKIDKFNCHCLSSNKIDINNPYFSKISKNLLALLNSEIYIFSQNELLEFSKSIENMPFTLIKIIIEELLKNYDECLKIFLEKKK